MKSIAIDLHSTTFDAAVFGQESKVPLTHTNETSAKNLVDFVTWFAVKPPEGGRVMHSTTFDAAVFGQESKVPLTHTDETSAKNLVDFVTSFAVAVKPPEGGRVIIAQGGAEGATLGYDRL